MRQYLDALPQAVEAAEEAIRAEGLEPLRRPIRGGTDGSLLSERGLPTPNLFTGGHEYHSVREWASLQDMAAAAATVVRLAGVWAADESLRAGLRSSGGHDSPPTA
jgi:tripeptide aminopeptidase